MIRRFPITKIESYENYLEECTTEIPQSREEYDNEMREFLRKEFPGREIEGYVTIIEDDIQKDEDAWFHWEYDYNHVCDCLYCNDETEIF
jgi:hypothetical protein